MIIIYISIVLCVLLDQLVKLWVVNQFDLHTGISVIDGILSLFYTRNDGAAWGILSGNRMLFYVITVLFIVGFAWWFHKDEKSVVSRIAYVCIIAGALGNFIDRVYLGYVVDMFQLDFIRFPIFNVADMFLTCGVALMLLETLVLERKHD
ncbi:MULTISPECIES: signal peptidase II [unclassified Granulicatella]|uniref:signal peptidase II n=1 Tax=unclassified Granulicatella TaxID=2630493 RepID=UPI0010740FAA|nr:MULTISPECIES: signal peptidase II [unclassified Granulicatella]MBF0779700.1 signal peptidase II [Granulicatella sp. 19428wC4_WM01]TFU96222.1 signal peptidase II [Granulicatella sp. WM01]